MKSELQEVQRYGRNKDTIINLSYIKDILLSIREEGIMIMMLR